MNKYFTKRESCPACTSEEWTTLIKLAYSDDSPLREFLTTAYSTTGVELEYLEGSHYTLDECNNCGLIFQEEIPNDLLMVRLYEHWIGDSVESSIRITQEQHTLEILSEHLYEFMKVLWYFDTLPSDVKVFDFGMGWGTWCRLAAGFGCDVYGTELSESRIEYAQARGTKVISWQEIPDHKFDLIYAYTVFEHLAEPLETLTYLKQALKPGGLVYITVPDGWDIKRRLDAWDWKAPKGSKNSLMPVNPLQHINCFTHDALVQMANIAGLSLVTIPEQYTFYSKHSIKALVKPAYHALRGKKSTFLYFQNT